MRLHRIIIVGLTFGALLTGSLFAQTPPTPAPPPPPVPQPQVPPALTQADKDAIKKMLNEAVVKGEDHPFQITCSATSGTCTPTSVFISAANISAIEINEIPANTNTLTVTVTAGESDQSGPLTVRRAYPTGKVPDHIMIAVSKARRFHTTYAGDGSSKAGSASSARNYLNTQSTPVPMPNSNATSDDPAIGFVTLGAAEDLLIRLEIDGKPKTIVAKMSYQRWFVDMGLHHLRLRGRPELVTEDAGGGNLRVAKKRRKDKVVPGTGIVLNFHLANYPSLAAQFGLATSVDRAASYYLGLGYRLRELGPKTLATFAFGIAATQVKRFPDVAVGDMRPATAVAITQGSNRYAFGPYLSLSLGFSFGGVEKPPAQPAQ